MSFLADLDRQRPSKAVEETELNIVPVMNTFLILIPFLVSMAVFAHVAIIPVNLPPDAGMGKGAGKKDLKLTVAVARDGFRLALGEELLDSLGLKGETFDYEGLRASLARIRPNLQQQDQAIVAVSDGIVFDQVVQIMDAAREGGFPKIGLSGSAEDKTP